MYYISHYNSESFWPSPWFSYRKGRGTFYRNDLFFRLWKCLTAVFSSLRFLPLRPFSPSFQVSVLKVFSGPIRVQLRSDKWDKAYTQTEWGKKKRLILFGRPTQLHTGWYAHTGSWPVWRPPRSKLTILQQSQLSGSMEREGAERRG